METVLLTAGSLSRFIVIKSNYYSTMGYAHYDRDGYALLGEESVFAETVKIEAERATVDHRYVNLRFCHSNKYWERKGGRYIVAESNKPDEDITQSSCTLFEAVSVEGGNGLFYLNHVESGGRLLLEEPSMRFYVEPNSRHDDQSHLSFVNWNSVVKLPEFVAFKGYNNRYLGFISDSESNNYLFFSFNDPNNQACGQEIHLMKDGSLRIKSKQLDRFWRRNIKWILAADSRGTTANNNDTLFWPVKLGETTIALRNAGNKNFCVALTTEGRTDCLNAAVNHITNHAKLVVQELVLWRKIDNVRYWVDNSRIYNEKHFAAGTTTATNTGDSEAQIAVELSYEDEKSYSFSHSYSLTFGAEITFTAGIPIIVNKQVEVGVETTAQMKWGNATTSNVRLTRKGSVTVPPRSVATVSYVGTTGTCDVPFSYTQEGTRSTDGAFVQSEHIDGVFKAVNNYNFSFVIDEVQEIL